MDLTHNGVLWALGWGKEPHANQAGSPSSRAGVGDHTVVSARRWPAQRAPAILPT